MRITDQGIRENGDEKCSLTVINCNFALYIMPWNKEWKKIMDQKVLVN